MQTLVQFFGKSEIKDFDAAKSEVNMSGCVSCKGLLLVIDRRRESLTHLAVIIEEKEYARESQQG